MQQTLLALAALAITMLLSFNQLNSISQSYGRMVDDELEVMGVGVAKRILETGNVLAFDERTTPAQWNANAGAVPATTELELLANFGNTPSCDFDELFKNATDCDDIDDLDMGPTEWQTIEFAFVNGDTLNFEANVQVHYVNETNLDTPLTGSSRSYFKLMVVKLRSFLHAGQSRHTNGFIEMRRVFSFSEELEAERAAAP